MCVPCPNRLADCGFMQPNSVVPERAKTKTPFCRCTKSTLRSYLGEIKQRPVDFPARDSLRDAPNPHTVSCCNKQNMTGQQQYCNECGPKSRSLADGYRTVLNLKLKVPYHEAVSGLTRVLQLPTMRNNTHAVMQICTQRV